MGLKLEQDDIVDLTHGAEADINIGEPDPEQTDPRPQHMTGIQATDAVVCLGTSGRLGFGVQEPADEVPERMTAKGVKPKENGIQNQDKGAHAQAKMHFLARVGEPHRQPGIVGEQKDEKGGKIKEIAVDILNDQREKSVLRGTVCGVHPPHN